MYLELKLDPGLDLDLYLSLYDTTYLHNSTTKKRTIQKHRYQKTENVDVFGIST